MGINHDKTVSHRINRNKNHEQFVSNKADVPSNGLIMGFQPIPWGKEIYCTWLLNLELNWSILFWVWGYKIHDCWHLAWCFMWRYDWWSVFLQCRCSGRFGRSLFREITILITCHKSQTFPDEIWEVILGMDPYIYIYIQLCSKSILCVCESSMRRGRPVISL